MPISHLFATMQRRVVRIIQHLDGQQDMKIHESERLDATAVIIVARGMLGGRNRWITSVDEMGRGYGGTENPTSATPVLIKTCPRHTPPSLSFR